MSWEQIGKSKTINLDNCIEQYKDTKILHRDILHLRCTTCGKTVMVDDTIYYKYCPHCGDRTDKGKKLTDEAIANEVCNVTRKAATFCFDYGIDANLVVLPKNVESALKHYSLEWGGFRNRSGIIEKIMGLKCVFTVSKEKISEIEVF